MLIMTFRTFCKVFNVYIEDIQWFDVEYGIYFTSKTGFLILVQSTREIITKSGLMSKINSIFKVKALNFLSITFSFYYIFFKFFSTCFSQILVPDVTSQSLVIFIP